MSKTGTTWAAMRDSLWFVPALMTIGAVLLAILTIHIDTNVVGDEYNFFLTFGGGASAARGILSAISSSVITVTGVVFSVTIVALQLASSQYTPRVLHNFTSDRTNQIVLGTFISTFTYSLLIQRRVLTATEEAEGFVPSLSVTVAIALALVSIGLLIYFIDHVARSIRAAVIIDRIAHDSIKLVEHLFPTPIGRPARDELTDIAAPDEPAAVVRAEASGYLEAVNEESIFELNSNVRLIVRMEAAMGEFIIAGEALASVWPADAVNEEVSEHIRNAFVSSPERTPYQDVERGMIELSDVAVKSLSAAVNDPTTANMCVDRLAEVLVAFGLREPPPRVRSGRGGKIHFIGRRQDFDHAVDVAMAPIRRHGAGEASVLRRLTEAIGRVAGRLPEDRHPALANELAAVLRTARDSIRNPTDLAEIERAADSTRRHTGPAAERRPDTRAA